MATIEVTLPGDEGHLNASGIIYYKPWEDPNATDSI
jgi:hypothetical protein